MFGSVGDLNSVNKNAIFKNIENLFFGVGKMTVREERSKDVLIRFVKYTRK